MEVHLNWFNSLVLFGAIQGIIFSLIVFSKRNHPGSAFLAAFFLVLAYNGLETFSWSTSFGHNILLFDILPFVFVFTLGPCLYLYTRSNIKTENLESRKIVWHFFLPAAQLFFQMSTYVYYNLVKDNVQAPSISPTILYNILISFSTPLSIVMFIYYQVRSWKLVIGFRKEVNRNRKKHHSMVLRWLSTLLLATSLLSIGWVATTAMAYWLPGHDGSLYYMLELSIVFFLYWIGIIGYHRINLLKEGNTMPLVDQFNEMSRQFHVLCQAMETEKLYLDPDLNQQKVSVHVGIKVKTISIVLNKVYRDNFNDFVNSYRVKEVQRRLDDQSYRHLTIAAIAFESGFNSNATFQRAFKNKIGVSPTEYLATLVTT